ncbi:hypothetical protein EG68_10287 [Paragonimus skrjabini miyazakii]|uniref:Major facilitator superfamily (MFS) profile domain-containing protein n=1 Tax=Paragonimus skrjabini miyazakii TaxID=59628 RepID=A0A8S9YFE5_9TREM|nr:hypothetical protein EG68_10287 [Paragonimus skrjabini miyazakii]
MFQGLVLGVFFWGYALTQFLAGYLSDRLGGERVIPCTSFLWSTLTLSFIYLPFVSSQPDVVYGLFVCTRFFLGVFQVAVHHVSALAYCNHTSRACCWVSTVSLCRERSHESSSGWRTLWCSVYIFCLAFGSLLPKGGSAVIAY